MKILLGFLFFVYVIVAFGITFFMMQPEMLLFLVTTTYVVPPFLIAMLLW